MENNDPSITIRSATRGDADCIAAFNIAMARETEGRGLDPQTVADGVLAVLSDPIKGRYFIAEYDNGIAGQMLLTAEWSDWRNGWFLWIQSVYVVPVHRNWGVFRALYEHAVDLARKECACGLRLYVHHENSPACRVYEKLGMIEPGYRFYEFIL